MKRNTLFLILLIMLMNIANSEGVAEYASHCNHSTHVITQEDALIIATTEFEHALDDSSAFAPPQKSRVRYTKTFGRVS